MCVIRQIGTLPIVQVRDNAVPQSGARDFAPSDRPDQLRWRCSDRIELIG